MAPLFVGSLMCLTWKPRVFFPVLVFFCLLAFIALVLVIIKISIFCRQFFNWLISFPKMPQISKSLLSTPLHLFFCLVVTISYKYITTWSKCCSAKAVVSHFSPRTSHFSTIQKHSSPFLLANPSPALGEPPWSMGLSAGPISNTYSVPGLFPGLASKVPISDILFLWWCLWRLWILSSELAEQSALFTPLLLYVIYYIC